MKMLTNLLEEVYFSAHQAAFILYINSNIVKYCYNLK